MVKLVAIITDFGLKDPYVGIMKGVILSIDPEIQIVDINNEITPFNVREGAFNLMVSHKYFPEGTVFLVVVDPGVGSSRKAIIVKSLGKLFVAPDNGVLTPILRDDSEAYELEIPQDASTTFHGRDVFAPAAARLASGVHPRRLGRPIESIKRIDWPFPRVTEDRIEGEVLLVDRFGNLITNIDGTLIGGREVVVEIGCRRIKRLSTHYSEVEKGMVLALIGSAGFLEISVREGNASEVLGVGVGDRVIVHLR